MRLCVLAMVALLLAACQTSTQRATQLAQICADPANREYGSFYFDECLTLYPQTPKQLQRTELLGRASDY